MCKKFTVKTGIGRYVECVYISVTFYCHLYCKENKLVTPVSFDKEFLRDGFNP